MPTSLKKTIEEWKMITPRLLIAIGAIVVGYMLFFGESREYTYMKAECAKRGEKAEKRRNAVTIDIIPYPLANFHYACSGDPQPLYRR